MSRVEKYEKKKTCVQRMKLVRGFLPSFSRSNTTESYSLSLSACCCLTQNIFQNEIGSSTLNNVENRKYILMFPVGSLISLFFPFNLLHYYFRLTTHMLPPALIMNFRLGPAIVSNFLSLSSSGSESFAGFSLSFIHSVSVSSSN